MEFQQLTKNIIETINKDAKSNINLIQPKKKKKLLKNKVKDNKQLNKIKVKKIE